MYVYKEYSWHNKCEIFRILYVNALWKMPCHKKKTTQKNTLVIMFREQCKAESDSLQINGLKRHENEMSY